MAGLFDGIVASSRLLLSTAQPVHVFHSSRVYRWLFGSNGYFWKSSKKENPGSFIM